MFNSRQSKVLPFHYRAILKILRVLLRRDPGIQPAVFRALAVSALNVNQEATIEAFVDVLANTKLTDAQVDQLVRAAILKSDQSVAINSLSQALEGLALTNAQIDKLIRASLGQYLGKEMPSQIFNLIEDLTGGSVHFSQEGEDVLLARMLRHNVVGYFVDIGAHHPTRFSNTYALYRNGWRGINIDATPGCMKVFERLRPEDTNIECAISNIDTAMKFYVFKEKALNTFDETLANEYIESGWMLERTITIEPRSLSSILDEHLPAGKHIDLLNVDVEGEELRVLLSNDWRSYRPDFILVEVLATPFDSLKSHPAISFLEDKGYRLTSRLANTALLRYQS
jgi:FkbM family methyltransferase